MYTLRATGPRRAAAWECGPWDRRSSYSCSSTERTAATTEPSCMDGTSPFVVLSCASA